ncbi:TIGR02328 family protein [Paenibacillus polygoni]|uniref:TIGR02328 family protein n=1 Tax=Paenibacillus polygoni TaxID=3050112 RepID=A0ABY8X249_9BACL|nr:TIGR02328 family protein [Paenibacillus polygoni]WIV19505.1 TIGR02328 family protein [Paenibacillus polygoni]
MRLWHEDLISKLPRAQLLGQHRECCALRGKGWGKKHATVNYVFEYHPMKLVRYHLLIIEEMKNRGYNVDILWEDPLYRGKQSERWEVEYTESLDEYGRYEEHNDDYMEECMQNLASKGIYIMIVEKDQGSAI